MKTTAAIFFVVLLVVAAWCGTTWVLSGPPRTWFTHERNIEVRQAGNTFTLIGHCDGCAELDTKINNMMTRKAGRVCAEKALATERVIKVGDQRYLVVCHGR